ncbi:B12-binding domain-containing radical SAM protein [Clostridium sp. YIM B02505]|uniref:B12-binding domain-containing radical SAM protein n=1 Tax=Clostridium yunnanense TaxID=2800325 RepID=A0ABS1EJK4_9CLOT|nr:radical SAM protein [Clostridium yunnanense]MBK1809542.1 B12-binding domain-containing radical SAM protein [Clostridium yunnanense]
MFKVALVVPFFRKEGEQVSYMEYLGFSSIAAYLRERDINVEIIDAYLQDLDMDVVSNKLIYEQYDLIGFTLMSSEFFNNAKMVLEKISSELIKRNITILAGGYYATFNSEKILKESNIDLVVMGEGERTILDLIDNLMGGKGFGKVKGIQYRENNNIIKTEPRNIMTSKELTELPMMARDTAEIVVGHKGKLQMLSSRGCYGNCDFCGVNKYTSRLKGEKWRYREAENVVDEMEILVNKYNVKEIVFLDEEFIGTGELGKDRARKIAQLIIDRNIKIQFLVYSKSNNVDFDTFSILKKSGLKSVFLGIEFGVQRILDFYNKGITINDNKNAIKILKDLNINIKPGYIMFEPTMNLQELRENFTFYFDYIGFKPTNLLNKLGLYKETPAYYKVKELTKVEEVEFLHKDYGDCVEYSFKHDKVGEVYTILADGLKRIENFNFRRQRISMLAQSKVEAITMQKKLEKEIYDVVIQLINSFETTEIFNNKIIEKLNDEFTNRFMFINSNL